MKDIPLLLIISIIVLCCSTSCNAVEDSVDIKKFTNEFLNAEFIGNNAFRVGNAIYSSQRTKKFIKNYALKGEIFIFESDQLCVVDNYEIIDIRINEPSAHVYVSFQEFARTGNKGYDEIPLIKTIKTEVVKYEFKFKNNRWWVYDPPIPRVSRKALIDNNKEIINSMVEWVQLEGTESQKKFYFNLVNTNIMLSKK